MMAKHLKARSSSDTRHNSFIMLDNLKSLKSWKVHYFLFSILLAMLLSVTLQELYKTVVRYLNNNVKDNIPVISDNRLDQVICIEMQQDRMQFL